MIFFLKQTWHSQTGGGGGGPPLGKNSHIFPFFYLGSVPYCGRAFHQKYQMFSNGNSTNFSTVRLRIIDIFSKADILNSKRWKKLNFRLPLEKMQAKAVNPGQYSERLQNEDFQKSRMICHHLNYSI